MKITIALIAVLCMTTMAVELSAVKSLDSQYDHVIMKGESLDNEQMLEMYMQWVQVYKGENQLVAQMPKFGAFKENVAYYQAHNAKTEKTFTMGLGPFADLTGDEFLAQYTMPKTDDDKCVALNRSPSNSVCIYDEETEFPENFDLC